jgi:hypothetical protein
MYLEILFGILLSLGRIVMMKYFNDQRKRRNVKSIPVSVKHSNSYQPIAYHLYAFLLTTSPHRLKAFHRKVGVLRFS